MNNVKNRNHAVMSFLADRAVRSAIIATVELLVCSVRNARKFRRSTSAFHTSLMGRVVSSLDLILACNTAAVR